MYSNAELLENPKLTRQALWANNTFPHLGFIPVSPTLSGPLRCLRDVNTPSLKYPFSSERHGDRYAGNAELIKDWRNLELKLNVLCSTLRQDPVPGATLEEEDYPMPSTFGYQRWHRSSGAANRALERSRDAFYPLIARASYFIFFLRFPAYQGPILRWEAAFRTPAPPTPGKRSPPEMSQASSKRLRTGDLPDEVMPPREATSMEDEALQEDAGDEHTLTYAEWKHKQKEKENPVGYDDAPYWQFLLARAGVPVVGISEVADSELAYFRDDYPRVGYIVHLDCIAKNTFRPIFSQVKSIPIWIEWGSSPQRDDYRGHFLALFPSQVEINKAMATDKGKGRALPSTWDTAPAWEPLPGWDTAPNSDETGDRSGRLRSADAAPPASIPSIPPRKKKHGQFEGETRDEFFARRAIERERRIAVESSKQKQRREGRASYAQSNQCPSSRKTGTTVFIWKEVGDQLEKEREQLTKGLWSRKWILYADSQRFYHDYCDEWDLCEALDPGARPPIDSEEEDDIEDSVMVVREPTPPPPYPPTSPPPPPISTALDVAVWGENLPDQLDTAFAISYFTPFEELLRLRYGFLEGSAELSIASTVQLISNDKAIRVLGYSKSSQPRLTSNASYLISLLATRLLEKEEYVPIPLSLLDTTVPPVLSPNEHFRLSHDYASAKEVYIITSKQPHHLGWQLALTHSTTALECMRRRDTNIGELVSFLVQSGRAFMTHRRRDQITLPIYRYPPPIIQASYRSSSRLPRIQEDYAYYGSIRSTFLSQPRGRAALMQGGIVWRLAIELFRDRAEDVVVNGPSDDVIRFGSSMSYSGNEYWDDALTDDEMDLICGVYKLYSKC